MPQGIETLTGTTKTRAVSRGPRLPPEIKAAVDAIDDRKGEQVIVLDLRGLTDATDFFIIASGTSDAHVRGIADGVLRAMQASGHRAYHTEGLTTGRWVLIDYVDFVVHLFHPETRAFYRLERLWQDAPAIRPGA